MEDRIRLSYFYGKEADQFSFYKIPKLLFTEEYFKKISVEAKVLYGLMLDRMSLSMKNQWMDDEGRAYIYYSLEDIMEALGCSNKKAISIMKELDTDAGIGLIEKKRQGQGKPTMIYLKQFMVQDVQKCRNFTSEQKAVVSEVKNLHVLKCKKAMSRSEEITLPEVKNIHTNKNNINNTELNDTDPSIYPDRGLPEDRPPAAADTMDTMGAYREIIKENIEYGIMRERLGYNADLLDDILDIMVDTVCSSKRMIRIGGEDYPREIVKNRLLKINSEHIGYVVDSLKENTTKVRNIRAYLLTSLYNAPTTMNSYYTALVNHDLYGGG